MRCVEMQLCPAWENPADLDLRRRRLPVAVGLDDHRRVVAQLQTDLLARRPRPDRPPDVGRPGERDQGDVGVVDERVADGRPATGDDVQPLGGQAALVDQQLGEGDAAERRLAGRLEHDRAPGGDRRGHLVGDEVEREVERADRPDDADRHAQREADLADAAGMASRATTSPASVRASAAANWNVPTARSASTRAVLIGLAASLAMISANSSRRSASSRAARVEHLRPLPPRQRSARQRRLGDAHGTVDVVGTAHGDPADLRAVVRRRDGCRLRTLEPLAGERRARVLHGHGSDHTAGREIAPCGPATPSSTGRRRSPSPTAAAPATPRRTRCRRSNAPSTSATATSRRTSR